MEKLTIELDCPPGNPRPGDLFPGLIAETGLKEDDFKLISKLFGNWTWELIQNEQLYSECRSTIKERIEALYKKGLIRYASW